MDIIGKRYLYFGISLLVIIPGLVALFLWGLPLAIDFTGGSLLEVRFDKATPPTAEVIALYKELGIGDATVQTSAENTLVIRSKTMDEAMMNKLVKTMEERFHAKIEIVQFSTVGPSVGEEVAKRAMGAVALSALAILAYITYAFRGVPHAVRYGTAAIIAMLHDVSVTIGMEAIFGHFLHWEADAMFLTALLTIIGFSVHDSIVVFDRIRENSRRYRRLPYEKLVNHSIVQTLDRSINTQLTVMLTLFTLALFGGVTTRHFVIILLIGIFSGTYSSIFNASPILIVWENREWRCWIKGKLKCTGEEATA
ncbi:MAG TPA: protein translocase subunit SecF [Chloroflexi bacterium]|nr:protein translocase subunit SecF [Chloroflexota bacterium]